MRLKHTLVLVGIVVFIAAMQASFHDASPSSEVPSEVQAAKTSGDAWAVARAQAGSTGSTARHDVARPIASGPVILQRGAGGHYFADVQIGGATINFLVDTGATSVALTEADARRIGLIFSPQEYRIVGRQVAGTVRGKAVTLDSVRLGSKVVRKVDAVIIEGATMSLLGQSFLNRAGRLEMDGKQMVIR